MNRINSLFRVISLPLYLFMIICLVFNSCMGTRRLAPDQLLYTGAIIKIHKDTVIEDQRKMTTILKDNVYPDPNATILGIPLKLIIYNSMGKAKPGNGINGFLKYNYGEKPVLLSDISQKDICDYLKDLLKANGYLDADVTSEEIIPGPDKKKRKIIYHCYLKPPYHITKIINGVKDSAIYRIMQENQDKTLIHPDLRYNLYSLKQERIRIDHVLKEKGYFYFSPDYIIYKADSTEGLKNIKLIIEVKPGLAPQNLRPWHVKNVIMNNMAVTDSIIAADTVTIRGVDLVLGKTFRPKAIRPFVLFGQGDLLTYDKYSFTNKNLSTVSAFKYTNLDISPDSLTENNLNIIVNLRPYEQRNFRAEADIISKSNSFAGPGLGVSHTNRNVFGGAEKFIVKLNGSAEAYLTKDTSKLIGNFNYELIASAELNIPRFLMINASRFPQRYIPHTHFKIEGRFVNQMRFYLMSFFRFNYGYRWLQNEYSRHELNPADINFQHMVRQTAYFDTLVFKNPLVKQSYVNQFMIGSSYFYQYSLPSGINRQFKTAFFGSAEISGNILYGLNLLAGKRRTNGVPLKLFGTEFSQFVKTTLDYRMYYSTARNNTLVSRMLIGVGLPLGNSAVLPDIKQYYAGGANSIRAFKLREVGPGGYNNTDNVHGILNRTGDIRLEGNLENRYKIARRFEIALFIDTGNIWLVEHDPLRPVSQFKFNQFYRQLAVGWGYGLRYLNDLFVIRVDVGNPLFSPIPLTKSPIINFAVGYPF